MGTVPTVHSWVNDEQPAFDDMNAYLEDVLTFLMNPPMVRLRRTTNQAIPTATSTAISWDFVEVETENMWDATNPTRLKPSTPGWYVGSCGYSFDANATGTREMNVIKNGSSSERILRLSQDAYTNAALTVTARGNVFMESFNGTTDYMTVEIQQTSGVTLNIVTTTVENQPDLVLRWFAPL